MAIVDNMRQILLISSKVGLRSLGGRILSHRETAYCQKSGATDDGSDIRFRTSDANGKSWETFISVGILIILRRSLYLQYIIYAHTQSTLGLFARKSKG